MTDVYWRPLNTGKWDFGAVAGLGFGFPSGNVNVTGPNNVNYGEGDISGNSAFTLEIMGLVDFALSEVSTIEMTLGWRDAVIKNVEVEKAPVYNEDGSQLALDYTGYVFKVGYKYIFGK